MEPEHPFRSDPVSVPLTRRQLLKAAGIVSASFAFGSALGACGSSEEGTAASATTSPGVARQGGILRVGIVGGSAKEVLDGQMGTTEPEICFYYQLYDALLGWDKDYQLIGLLAEEVSPNADATVWTAKLRQGVIFHDGKSLTADDVVWSFKRIINPKDPKAGAASLADLPASGIRKVDANTVAFHLDNPNSVFAEQLAHYNNCILPQGFDLAKPVGTGPFKLTSFKPGEGADFAANSEYYAQAPFVDELKVIEFNDPVARVNAFIGGSVEAISQLPSAQVPVVEQAGLSVLDARTAAWQPFTMRVDVKPYDDVRVRQAFRLMVDREAMIAQAYTGFGAVGNDMYAPFDPGYPKDLPQREQDLEQAKSLLKQAGYGDGLTVTLNTSDAVGSAAVAAAQVFAEQAKGAGVTIKVNKVDPAVFYGDGYLQWDFAQDFWYTRNYLAQTAQGSLPGAPFNETHWSDPSWVALIKQAMATGDETKRNEIAAEAMKIEYEQGGYIVWAFNDQIDAYSSKIGGVQPYKSGVPLAGFHFNEFYFV